MNNEKQYDEGFEFLKIVNKKLKERLNILERELSAGQREIENMHEYYWENYTEMDQYGYEDYDNQQALLHQINSNEQRKKLKHRIEKMLDNPFFGRVDFVFEGESEAESFYIGIGNFSEQTGMTPLIYDWRAPVSGLFYDYDKGPASYEAPAGIITGDIVSKWQYKIRKGKMLYGFESDVKIDDEILKQELGSNSDVSLKNIVRTIQKEQNAVIRNTGDRILVIQGAAGSGKTSIALHRIAYLLYHDRNNLKSSNVLILSPNSVFADYISHILPELGEENIQEMSFDLFAYKELTGTAADCEDRYDQLERNMKYPDPTAEKRFQWKQSRDFIAEIEGFLASAEDLLMEFRSIEFHKMKLSEEELIHLFYDKFFRIPLLGRMNAVMEYYIDSYETLKGRNIDDEDREYLQKKFENMYISTDIYSIYNMFLESCGQELLPDVPYERRKIPYEDVYPMLYLKYRITGKSKHKNIKHLVIDEMQDYSYIQYTILQYLFDCRMTILGDKAQTLGKEQQDVLKFLPNIFGKNIKTVVINKSYRNTWEIASYASTVSGISDLEFLERHGKPVEEKCIENEEKMLLDIKKNLRTGTDGIQSKFETAAVLTMTEERAFDLFRLLQNIGVEANYVDKNSSSFKKGLTVTTFYLAKGLEFDQVFEIKEKENPLSEQASYICATRALHELYVYK